MDLGIGIGVDDDLFVGGFADGTFFIGEEGSEAEVAGGADVVVAAGCDASFLVEVGGVADEAVVVVEAFFFFDECGFGIWLGWDRFADTVALALCLFCVCYVITRRSPCMCSLFALRLPCACFCVQSVFAMCLHGSFYDMMWFPAVFCGIVRASWA